MGLTMTLTASVACPPRSSVTRSSNDSVVAILRAGASNEATADAAPDQADCRPAELRPAVADDAAIGIATRAAVERHDSLLVDHLIGPGVSRR